MINYIENKHIDDIIRITPFDTRLSASLSLPMIRIAIYWDTDMTDVELTINEPNNCVCNCYRNASGIRNTNGSQGFITRQFTQGYGPVVYCNNHPSAGKYLISVRYNAIPAASAPKSVCCFADVYLGGELIPYHLPGVVLLPDTEVTLGTIEVSIDSQ